MEGHERLSRLFSGNLPAMFAFLLIFGAKRKHTGPTSSESAKDLVRIIVLAEKLDLWWKLQFAALDAKN